MFVSIHHLCYCAAIPLTLGINKPTVECWQCGDCLVMSILSLKEKEHIANYLAALIDFGRAMFTSHVQSNPQCSRDQAQTTGRKHTILTLLRVTVEGIRVWMWTCSYCHFSSFSDSFNEWPGTRWNISILDKSSIVIHAKNHTKNENNYFVLPVTIK